MGHRSNNAERCERCRMHVTRCLCAEMPRLQTRSRLILVMHYRETTKTTATGPLAAEMLRNSETYLHGLAGQALDLTHLHAPSEQDRAGRRVLVLFPSEEARPLSASLLAEDERPVSLVVPDGNWRQATRVPKRVPGLTTAEKVTLPQGLPTAWGIRRETRDGGLATFEAIARAFGILESEHVQKQMEEVFDRMVRLTMDSRGYEKDGTPRRPAGA